MFDAHTYSEKHAAAPDLGQNLVVVEKTKLFVQIWSGLAAWFWHCGETASKSSHEGFRGLL